jgi:hypothetical protein
MCPCRRLGFASVLRWRALEAPCQHVLHQHLTSVIGSKTGALLAGCGFFKTVIRAADSNEHR